MAVFELNEPVKTEEPRVVVENELKPGEYVFTLVVVVDGVESKPVARRVIVSEEAARPFAIPAARVPKLQKRGRTSKSTAKSETASETKPKTTRKKK